MSDPFDVLILAVVLAGMFGAGWCAGVWFGLRLAFRSVVREGEE